jgi:hypothetical protein
VTHILKHVPSTRRYPECCEVSQIDTFLRPSTKDVHGVINQRSRVAFSGNRYVAYAVKLAPGIRTWVVCPNIVKPNYAVGTAKSK